MECLAVSTRITESRESRGVKPKIKGHKINGLYWQGALKRKKLTEVGPKARTTYDVFSVLLSDGIFC